MAYEVTPIEAPIGTVVTNKPNEFNLPVREFAPYDRATIQKPGAETTTKAANAPQTGTPVEQVEKPTEESMPVSPKIAAVARAEAKVKAERAQLESEKREFQAALQDAAKYKAIAEKLAKKDFSAVEELGAKYEDHLKYATDKVEGQDPREQKIRTLEQEIKRIQKTQEETASADYENNQQLWREEITNVVKANKDFSPISKLKLEEAVLAHINSSFEEDNVKLTADQAIKDVLEELKNRKSKYDDAFTTESETEVPVRKVLGAPERDVNTITQQMTVTSKTPSKKPFHLMSESEQLAEAIRRVEEDKLKRMQMR
jgi:hypothetical protein